MRIFLIVLWIILTPMNAYFFITDPTDNWFNGILALIGAYFLIKDISELIEGDY